jgi:hypothetical protein
MKKHPALQQRVLLFEDRPIGEMIKDLLEAKGHFVILIKFLPTSPSHPSFQKILANAETYDLVIWDEEMVDGKVTIKSSDGFIQAFKKVYGDNPVPMIANSSEADCRWQQLTAGCSHECVNKNVIALLSMVDELLPVAA